MSKETFDTFQWAQDKEANVHKPLQVLLEKGWSKGDIPKASNVNWIFQKISSELSALRKDMVHQAEALGKKLLEQQETITQMKAKHSDLSKKHQDLKNSTHEEFHRAFHECEFNEVRLRSTLARLKDMEKAIRHFHPDFPEFHWSLENSEENENSEKTAGPIFDRAESA